MSKSDIENFEIIVDVIVLKMCLPKKYKYLYN